MQKNTKQSYSPLTRWIHWIMAVLILGLLTAGYVMTGVLEDGDTKWAVYGIHKSIGLIILATIWIRLWWRMQNDEPKLPKDLPRWQQWAGRANVRILLALLVIMPVSGFFMSYLGDHPISFFGLFTIPGYGSKHPLAGLMKDTHETAGLALAILVGLHILAALYHQFIRKDNVFKSMWGS